MALWNDVIVEEDDVIDVSIIYNNGTVSKNLYDANDDVDVKYESFDINDANLVSFTDAFVNGQADDTGRDKEVPAFPVISKKVILVAEDSFDGSNLFMDSLMPHPVVQGPVL